MLVLALTNFILTRIVIVTKRVTKIGNETRRALPNTVVLRNVLVQLPIVYLSDSLIPTPGNISLYVFCSISGIASTEESLIENDFSSKLSRLFME